MLSLAATHFALFAGLFLLGRSLQCFKGRRRYDPHNDYCACYFQLSIEDYKSPVYLPQTICNDVENNDIKEVLDIRCRNLKSNESYQGTASYVKMKRGESSLMQDFPVDVFLFCCKDCPELTTENSKFFDAFVTNGLKSTFREEMALEVHNWTGLANVEETTCQSTYNRRVRLLPGNHACMLFAASYSKTPVYAGNVMYRYIHRPYIASMPGYGRYCSFHKDQMLQRHMRDESCVQRNGRDYLDITCCCYKNLSNCGALESKEDVICANLDLNPEYFLKATSDEYDLALLAIGKNCFSEFVLKVKASGAPTLTGIRMSADTGTECAAKGGRHELACKVLDHSETNKCAFFQKPAADGKTLYVRCCCGAVDGGDQSNQHLCNRRRAFNFTTLLSDKRDEPQCYLGHSFKHYFANHVFGNSCIIHFDFTLMKPVDLLLELNMLLAAYETTERAYRTNKTLVLVDVIADIDKATSSCNDSKNAEAMLSSLQSKYKAWTVAVIKCDPSPGNEKCDQKILESLATPENVEEYQEKFGTECYVGTKENVTIKRSLKTRWCYERVRGFGENVEYERDFFMIDTISRIKNAPKTFQCLDISKGTTEYATSMRRNCFTRKVTVADESYNATKIGDTGEDISETFCCCINLSGTRPCNFRGMTEHFDRSSVHYGHKDESKRPKCEDAAAVRSHICYDSQIGRHAHCFYVADLQHRIVSSGCVYPTDHNEDNHPLAGVCETEPVLKQLQTNGYVSLFSEVHASKLFCCYGDFGCKVALKDARDFVQFFKTFNQKVRPITEAFAEERAKEKREREMLEKRKKVTEMMKDVTESSQRTF